MSGARSGELLALRWTDLELPKEGPGRIAIRRSLSWARRTGEEIRPRFYPPKTRAGIRTIGIPAELVSELRRWGSSARHRLSNWSFQLPRDSRCTGNDYCGKASIQPCGGRSCERSRSTACVTVARRS